MSTPNFTYIGGKRKKILTGQEAADYLQKNQGKEDIAILDPNKLAQGQTYVKGYSEKDLGFLGNLGKEIIRPFYNAKRFVFNELTDNEKDNKGEFLIKTGLGIASNFIPVGRVATLGNLVRQGAISGALGSIAGQELGKGLDIGGALTGAATGGAIGAVLGKLAKPARSASDEIGRVAPKTSEEMQQLFAKSLDQSALGRKVDEFGRSITQGNPIERFAKNQMIGERIKATGGRGNIDFVQDFTRDRANLTKLTDMVGLAPTEENLAKAADAFVKGTKNFINQQGGAPFKIDDLVSATVKRVRDTNLDLPEQEIARLAKEVVKREMGDVAELTPGALQDLAGASAAKRIQVERQMQTGIRPPTPEAQVLAAVDRASRDLIAERIPGYSQRSDIIESLIRTAPDRANFFNATGAVSQSGSLNPVRMATKAVTQGGGRALYEASRLPQTVTRLLNTGAKAATEPINNVLQKLGVGAAARTAVNKQPISAIISGTINRIGAQRDPLSPDQPIEEQKTEEVAQDDIANAYIREIERPEVDRMAILNQALAMSGGNMTRALPLANYMISAQQPRKFSNDERKTIFSASNGLAGVTNMANLLSKADLNVLAAQAYLPNFLRSKEAQLFSTYVDQISEGFGRLSSGGAITQNEEKRFLRFIPSFGDDIETVRYKLQELQRAFEAVMPR